MKVSNCCGVSGNSLIDKFDPCCDFYYADANLCSKCGEHCTYVEEDKRFNEDDLPEIFTLKNTNDE